MSLHVVILMLALATTPGRTGHPATLPGSMVDIWWPDTALPNSTHRDNPTTPITFPGTRAIDVPRRASARRRPSDPFRRPQTIAPSHAATARAAPALSTGHQVATVVAPITNSNQTSPTNARSAAKGPTTPQTAAMIVGFSGIKSWLRSQGIRVSDDALHRAIGRLKDDVPGNPDVALDTSTGDVVVKKPGGRFGAEPLGNLRDELGYVSVKSYGGRLGGTRTAEPQWEPNIVGLSYSSDHGGGGLLMREKVD